MFNKNMSEVPAIHENRSSRKIIASILIIIILILIVALIISVVYNTRIARHVINDDQHNITKSMAETSFWLTLIAGLMTILVLIFVVVYLAYTGFLKYRYNGRNLSREEYDIISKDFMSSTDNPDNSKIKTPTSPNITKTTEESNLLSLLDD